MFEAFTSYKALLYAIFSTGILALAAPGAVQADTLFNYTGYLEFYAIPDTGLYDITAFGAEGGSFVFGADGGLGAEIGGNIVLTAGQTLTILVGGEGGSGSGGGGGGGTYVVLGGAPLVIAGGGGGGADGAAGGNGLIGNDGGQGGDGGSLGGVGGAGGGGATAAGGGGGGGFSGAGSAASINGGGGGGGFPGSQGGYGACVYQGLHIAGNGGFGGGGGGGCRGAAFVGGGGGGGGYSGGGGGTASEFGGGGGGGSYLDRSVTQLIARNAATGDGLVDIGFVGPAAVPEPSTWALMVLGFAGLGFAGFRNSCDKAALLA